MGDKKDWKADIRREIKKLEEWKLTDRLSMTAALAFAKSSLASTVAGWNIWLANPIIMERFDNEHMKALVDKFNSLAVSFLRLDLEYTELMEEVQKKEDEENRKDSHKENQKKIKSYTA